jgi:HSP20 family protein
MDVKEKTTQPAVTRRSAPDFTEQLIEPFSQLRSEVDRLFDSFPFRLPSLRLGRMPVFPAIETTETKKQYKVTAELPGMEPDDVEVTFDDGFLRIAGEKSEKREADERGYHLSERSYGAFERVIDLPAASADAEISAKFKNGVLTVSVPKNKKASKSKKITIKADA